MPCRVDPIHVNYKSENDAIRDLADVATVGLDRARERVLKGETPDMFFFVEMDRFFRDNPGLFDGSWKAGAPYEGVLLDEKLAKEFLRLYNQAGKIISGNYSVNDVRNEQMEHRKEDIARLRIVFSRTGDEEMLAKTLGIDYTQPLEPQLGFDPDKY